MFDEYFEELDPAKRKKILDSLQPEPGQEETVEQMRRLFATRYKLGKRVKKGKEVKADKAAAKEAAKEAKKNKENQTPQESAEAKVFNLSADVAEEYSYNDGFIVNLVNIRNIAFDPRDRFGSRADEKEVKRSVHALCLDRTDEFSEEVLYHEMRQLLDLYIDTCLDDSHYQSIVFGMGHLERNKIRAKLELDMHYFWQPIEKFYGQDQFLFFKNAIMDTMDKHALRT